MGYATYQDMVDYFGEREVRLISDRGNTGTANIIVIEDGLRTADGEIDSFIAGRYSLPLRETPRVLVGIACDIARYRLTGTERIESSVVLERYRMAIRYLEKVAAGSVTLGAGVNTGTVVESGEDAVQFCVGAPRQFTRRSTGGGAY
ncbi:gp436 family protein [Enterobacter ludwigii]|uniref:gp436 family protein n=1 Tax=Enterobacter TaxID=547 RepID=UPI003BEF4970